MTRVGHKGLMETDPSMSSIPGSASGVASTRVRAGDVIADKYEVERVLAAGGMGVVVAAQHRQLRRRVALKFLLPELCAKQEVVDRFLREAQAMTTIQNEHVARVLDVGTGSDGLPFMVMEFLEGEDLGQCLDRRGNLPVQEAVDFVLQAMEALAEAHSHGFVHRDLKPSNLFVTKRPDGSPLVKVLDFGISKAISQDAEAKALTQTHGLLGSPLYMSPEQIRSSKKVDTRADIWTLGVILHELVTGVPPFEADNVAAVLAMIIAEDPTPLDQAMPDPPPGLAEVVAKCLKRDREQRYKTVGDLAEALRPFASREGHLSIERIARMVAHHVRVSTPVDLKIPTPPKNITPLHGGSDASPLAATAAQSRPPPPSNPRTSSPGSKRGDDATFGKYKLLAILGHGGMADVFLAVLGGPEGLGFNKLVVVKRLRPGLANDPEFVAMLVDEARIAARLSHPNVVQTHEVGVIDNEYYIAMEYLDGQPLHRIVQRTRTASPIPLAFRLGIVRDMLAGLHHAHELSDFDGTKLGVIHRDVTPQNLFVTYDGQVKLVDFGIAKARGRATETQQGVVKGKIGYMAPEQAGGQELDRRTDIFGAGVMLWELLTGERLWKGLDDVAIMQKLLLDKIPSSPRAANPEVHKTLDAIVKKALSRKKTDRYATAQDMQLEIERFMEAENLKCAPRDLGEWLAGVFVDRRKQTRSLIEQQLSAARAPTSNERRIIQLIDTGPNATPASNAKLQSLDRDATITDESVSRPDAAMSRSHPGSTVITTPTTLGRAKTLWAIAGGVSIVLATLLVVGLKNRQTARPENPIPTATTTPTVVASTPPVVPSATATVTESHGNDAPIQLLLSAVPQNAEFSIDDEPKVKTPATLTRPRDKKEHKITVTAPGHKPETKTVRFDENVVWAPQLVPAATGGHVVVPTTKPTPSATAAQPTNTAAPTTSGGRRIRPLDPDNPYGN